MKSILLLILFSVPVIAQLDSTISYFENGKISSIIRFNSGVRDGEASFFWENGNKKEEFTYINGRIEGLVKRFFENGNLREMFVIQSRKREGPTSLFDSLGNYVEDIFYEEGILVVDKLVLDDGKYTKLLASNDLVESEMENQPQQKKKKVNGDTNSGAWCPPARGPAGSTVRDAAPGWRPPRSTGYTWPVWPPSPRSWPTSTRWFGPTICPG